MYSGSGWNHDWTVEEPENNNREGFLLLISLLLSWKNCPQVIPDRTRGCDLKMTTRMKSSYGLEMEVSKRGPGLCYFWEDRCLLSLDGSIFIPWILATHSMQGHWTEVSTGSWCANCFFSWTWISSQKGHSLLTCFSINFGPNSSSVLGARAPS